MEKREQVKRIFDSISYRYDLLNHLLSLGVDKYWRKRALKIGRLTKDSRLLDVACGTGDFSIQAEKFGVKKIIGADLSFEMLKEYNRKSDDSHGMTVQAVAENLPFMEKSFTHITVAFGVRNFYDILQGFNSFHRILEINGRVIILEFSLPKNLLVKKFYLFYFNNILPFLGRIISKDKEAYTYLPESVNSFDMNVDLVELLSTAGFKNILKTNLTFGIVQVIRADKL
jgi:demethylmenaquinone methyltransferase/2-methoxy-6-polyprenyl-1,4-benzoquinol methylase